MKKLLAALLVIATCSLSAQENKPLQIGASIPMADTKMKSVSGKEVSIKDAMKKNGVLVMFSCNTCPYVVKYQSRTADAIKEVKKNNIGIIIVNSNEEYRGEADSYSAMQAYAKEHGYKDVNYVVDEKSALADAFDANRTPECFLFDSKGKLVYHGAIDDNQNIAQVSRKHLSMAISEMVGGKEVSMKETRSIGCMIKRI